MRSSDFILFRFSFHFDGSSATMAKQIASRNQYRIRQPTDSMDGSSVDVEAEQLHSNILSQVLGPFQNCLYGSGLSSCHQLVFGDDDVHEIVENLLLEFPKASKKRTIALQELYTLTDSERQSNRRAVVCTTRFNVMHNLASCLSSDASANDRRKALLIVANLCIPMENKAVILLSETVHSLLPALLYIITERLEESYLAAACLFNLSLLEDGKMLMLSYTVPLSSLSGAKATQHIDNRPEDDTLSLSLLRILEKLMLDYAPFLAASTAKTSVQSEAFRWSMGILRNLVTNQYNARIVALKTIVPALAVNCLNQAATNTYLEQWTRDSLPDACLMLLIHLAQSDEECLTPLRGTDYTDALTKIKGGGIHELRAKVLLGVLDDRAGQGMQIQST